MGKYQNALKDISEGYEEARDEEFNEQFRDFLKDYEGDILNEDDVQGFIDSFNFPDVVDWSASEYESQQDSYEDDKYQAWKERDI